MKKIFFTVLLSSTIFLGQTIDNNYKVEKKIIGGAKKNSGYNLVTYSVKSNDGKELYQIVDKVDYDIPFAKVEVFENGGSVMINSFSGLLTFIDNTGSKFKIKKIAEDINIMYERNILSCVDGENLIILFSKPNSEYSVIQEYNSEGSLEREARVNIDNVNGVAFSQNLNQIYLSYVKWDDSNNPNKFIVIVNENGKEIKRLKANFENGFFTKDNQFIGRANKSVICFNGKRLQLNFKSKVEENYIILDVAYNSEEVIVASAQEPKLKAGKWMYQNPKIRKFDLEGNIVDSKLINSNQFTEFGFKNVNGTMKFMTTE